MQRRSAGRPAREEIRDEQRGDKPRCELGKPVGRDVPGRAFAAQEHGEGDGGVEMPARHMAAGEDHDHERGADGERGERRAAAHGHADGEHEEEGADELDEVFFHGWWGCARIQFAAPRESSRKRAGAGRVRGGLARHLRRRR